jgi:sugar/nucleoside kinase (ribokinase family)
MKTLTPWLMQTDILILNREEAAELAEQPPRHLDAILHRLSPMPRQALIITDGQKGAYVHARGTTWYAPALAGKRINTTGAGDAFGSAFTAMSIKTGNLELGLRAGMLNSLGVITHMGAKTGILKKEPTAAELKKVKVRTLSIA